MLEFDNLDLGKMLFHVEQVRNFGSAPAINALVIITDHAQIAMLARQRMNKFELGGVRILIFIHHHVTVFALASFERLGMFGEETQCEQD